MNNKELDKFISDLCNFDQLGTGKKEKTLEKLKTYTSRFILNGTSQHSPSINYIPKNGVGWWYVINEDMVTHVKKGQKRHKIDGPAVIYFNDDIDENDNEPVKLYFIENQNLLENDYFKHPLVLENMISKISEL